LVKPKKHLGQHFLADKNIARKIANSLIPDKVGTVFEIGPGTGVLTEFLLEKWMDKVWLFEIDPESVEVLKVKFPEVGGRLIARDFLQVIFDDYGNGPLALIGNLPYNISSQILFKVIDNRNRVDQMVCMIQKEVAERITAPPGNREYGILSVMLQAWFNVEYLFTVGEKVFIPPPKVKSAVIRLRRNAVVQLGCDEQVFRQVVKMAFNQRRKTLRNAIRPFLNEKTITAEILNKRAEELSVVQFIELTNLVSG
jgi:16S rRNA (adenine1518-N6/adenine1519-N6)-dimethyltransferase